MDQVIPLHSSYGSDAARHPHNSQHKDYTCGVLLPSQVSAIRLVNEAQLAALALDVTTGVVVDVGESGVYVTPIFDGVPVPEAARSERCGGGHLTRYLDYMLLSRTNETYNQMVGWWGVVRKQALFNRTIFYWIHNLNLALQLMRSYHAGNSVGSGSE